MKKHNISQFFKSKSFYVVLFVAVIAIAAVTVVGVNLKSDKTKQNNLADLNTPIDVAENDETNIGEDLSDAANKIDAATNEQKDTTDELVLGNLTNDELLEYDLGSDSYNEDVASEEPETIDQAANNTQNNETSNTDLVADANEPKNVDEETANEEPEESVSVMHPGTAVDSLKFSNESVIGWPVKGNVIMPFSVEKLVHYATLGEWKTSSAVMISCEAGENVVAATRGIVSKVENNEETGTTVTMNVGNGYEIVYGQLTEVSCAPSDVIEEGTVIGKIAEPTKYYSVEGSNLYLKILCDGTPVNPMLFLTGEE